MRKFFSPKSKQKSLARFSIGPSLKKETLVEHPSSIAEESQAMEISAKHFIEDDHDRDKYKKLFVIVSGKYFPVELGRKKKEALTRRAIGVKVIEQRMKTHRRFCIFFPSLVE